MAPSLTSHPVPPVNPTGLGVFITQRRWEKVSVSLYNDIYSPYPLYLPVP